MHDTLIMQFMHGRETFMASPSEIIRLQAHSNYTYVYFKNHPPVLMAKVLRVYAELLRPFGFVRTHRSHLVNPQYIHDVDEQGNLRMQDASHAEISRRRKSVVKQSLGQYISG